MFGEVGNIIGQLLSLVAVATGCIAFQMKSARSLLAIQITTALLFSAHYFLIGAMTATVLNFIGAVKLLCYYIRNKRQSKNPAIPSFFSCLVLVTSILTWDGWYSIFLMTGLFVNSIGFSFSNVQTIRKLNLIKSPLCLIYNLFVLSVGGIIHEIAVTTSTIIALIKYREKKSDEKTA